VKNLILFIPLLWVVGCTTLGGSHVLTGNARPAISGDGVKIYSEAPEKFERIGIVNAHVMGASQRATDVVMTELKRQAGLIGANGILLNGSDPNFSANVYIPSVTGGIMVNQNGTSISGLAIFVP
jgi:hypothetical protein